MIIKANVLDDVDVTIENHGGMYSFKPHTHEAVEWINKNVHTESWQWLDSCLWLDDCRLSMDIADGMMAAGLKVV